MHNGSRIIAPSRCPDAANLIDGRCRASGCERHSVVTRPGHILEHAQFALGAGRAAAQQGDDHGVFFHSRRDCEGQLCDHGVHDPWEIR